VIQTLVPQADLAPYNSFGLSERAERLLEVQGERQLLQALEAAGAQGWPVTVIGGGSNLVLGGPVPGLVLVMRSRGRRVVSRSGQEVVIEAEAGENWHALVQWSLDLGLSGLENLALIPGTVGAAPVQNIGAYGVELCDSFHSLDALDRHTGKIRQFVLSDCAFAYRDSLFKQQAGRFIILRVRLKLSRRPRMQIDYAPLRAAWQATGLVRPDPRVVAELVCGIRRSKLPDPAQIGNAGSFFKNPVVTARRAETLRASWPSMPGYPQLDGSEKLAAGWLIEQAGWKGRRLGPVGVHSQQALVLVNHGGARGEQVLDLARQIRQDVFARFGVELEMEPQVLGSS
jgi:UDP-N-acetylmuramate dehydrogenase